VDALEQIAAAVLYEGYVLWPYRRSARKNRQRWTFGGVYPRGFVEVTRSGDAWRVETQCLVVGDDPQVEVELRFLQVVDRRVALLNLDVSGELEFVDELQVGAQRILAWDEAIERRFPLRFAGAESLAPKESPRVAASLELSSPKGAPLAVQIAVRAGEGREPVDGGVIVRSWEELAGSCEMSIDPLGTGGWVCEVLDDRQRRNLERYTRYHLAIANQTI
jgi:hypothetical protein